MTENSNPKSPEFSADILRLVQQLQESRSEQEKVSLLVMLAGIYASRHDFSDVGVTDDFHEFIEEFERCEMQFRHASLRLGRVVAQCIQVFLQSNNINIAELLKAVDTPKATN